MAVRLLVSVRDAAEAAIAVAAGADIIDVKEPDRGSLGFAAPSSIVEVLRAVPETCPVSAALGECVDWDSDSFPQQRELHLTEMPTELTWVKLGLAGMAEQHLQESAVRHAPAVPAAPSSLPAAWSESWLTTRHDIQQQCGWTDVPGHELPSWVAVAYADHHQACCPSPEDVLAAAMESDCAGLLIDTFRKGYGSTLDQMSESALSQLQRRAHEGGLFFALAGQLMEEHMSVVRRLSPDILAVRGAVCEGNERRAKISADKVRALKDSL